MVESDSILDSGNKADDFYTGPLNFAEVKANPILQPIVEVNSIYESMGLMVQRATWEYDKLKKEIDEMIQINSVYSETVIMGKIQMLLMHVKQIIHSQDVQRENIKKTIMEMVKITKKYYELKPGVKEDYKKKEFPFAEMEEITEKKSEKEKKENKSRNKKSEIPSLLPDLKKDLKVPNLKKDLKIEKDGQKEKGS